MNPRKRDNEFGFNFEGYIKVPNNGNYTFTVGSDDGSLLYISDYLIVDNDGNHSYYEKSGKISLQAGYHKIKLEYTERTGLENINVYWQYRSNERTLIPDNSLYMDISGSNLRASG